MDVNETYAKLNELKKGHRITYHVGFLARDRGPEEAARKTPQERDVCIVSATAWNLARRGKVSLVQERVSKECWAYVAVGLN